MDYSKQDTRKMKFDLPMSSNWVVVAVALSMATSSSAAPSTISEAERHSLMAGHIQLPYHHEEL